MKLELNTWNFIGVAEGRFRRNFVCLEIAGSFLLFGGYSVGLHNDVLRFDFGMHKVSLTLFLKA